MKPSALAARTTQLTLLVVWLFLGGRFLLRMFNADATNRFVSWVYDISAPLVHPFFNWFVPARTGDGFIVELQTLFAVVVYTFLAFVVMAVIGAWARRADSATPKRMFALTLSRRE